MPENSSESYQNQVKLLQQLVHTLQRQIESKNRQQGIVMQQLDHLSRDNNSLYERCSKLQVDVRRMAEKEDSYKHTIHELEEYLQKAQAEIYRNIQQLENLKRAQQQKQALISSKNTGTNSVHRIDNKNILAINPQIQEMIERSNYQDLQQMIQKCRDCLEKKSQIENMNIQIDTLNAQIKTLSGELVDKTKQIQQNGDQWIKFTKQLQAVQQYCQILEKDKQVHLKEIQTKDRYIAQFQLSKNKTQHIQDLSENINLENIKNAYELKIKQAEQSFKEKQEIFLNQITQQQIKLKNLQDLITDLNCKSQLTQSIEIQPSKNKNIDSLKQQNQQLLKNMQQIKIELDTIQSILQQKQSTIEQLQSHNEQITHVIAQLQQNNQQLSKQVDSLERQKSDMFEQLQQMTESIQLMSKQFQQLQKQKQEEYKIKQQMEIQIQQYKKVLQEQLRMSVKSKSANAVQIQQNFSGLKQSQNKLPKVKDHIGPNSHKQFEIYRGQNKKKQRSSENLDQNALKNQLKFKESIAHSQDLPSIPSIQQNDKMIYKPSNNEQKQQFRTNQNYVDLSLYQELQASYIFLQEQYDEFKKMSEQQKIQLETKNQELQVKIEELMNLFINNNKRDSSVIERSKSQNFRRSQQSQSSLGKNRSQIFAALSAKDQIDQQIEGNQSSHNFNMNNIRSIEGVESKNNQDIQENCPPELSLTGNQKQSKKIESGSISDRTGKPEQQKNNKSQQNQKMQNLLVTIPKQRKSNIFITKQQPQNQVLQQSQKVQVVLLQAQNLNNKQEEVNQKQDIKGSSNNVSSSGKIDNKLSTNINKEQIRNQFQVNKRLDSKSKISSSGQIDIAYLRSSIAQFGPDIDFNSIAKHIGFQMQQAKMRQSASYVQAISEKNQSIISPRTRKSYDEGKQSPLTHTQPIKHLKTQSEEKCMIKIPLIDQQLMRSSYGSNNQYTQIVLYYQECLSLLNKKVQIIRNNIQIGQDQCEKQRKQAISSINTQDAIRQGSPLIKKASNSQSAKQPIKSSRVEELQINIKFMEKLLLRKEELSKTLKEQVQHLQGKVGLLQGNLSQLSKASNAKLSKQKQQRRIAQIQNDKEKVQALQTIKNLTQQMQKLSDIIVQLEQRLKKDEQVLKLSEKETQKEQEEQIFKQQQQNPNNIEVVETQQRLLSETQRQTLSTQIQQLKVIQANTLKQNASLQEQINNRIQKVKQYEQFIQNLSNQLLSKQNTFKITNQQKEQQINDLKEKVTYLQIQINTLNQTYKEQESQACDEKNRQFKTLYESLEESNQCIILLNEEKLALNQQFQNLKESLSNIEQKEKQINNTLEKKDKQIIKCEQIIQSQRSQKQVLQDKNNELLEKLNVLQTRSNLLQQQLYIARNQPPSPPNFNGQLLSMNNISNIHHNLNGQVGQSQIMEQNIFLQQKQRVRQRQALQINSLVELIQKFKAQTQELNEIIQQKDRIIEELEDKIDGLQKKQNQSNSQNMLLKKSNAEMNSQLLSLKKDLFKVKNQTGFDMNIDQFIQDNFKSQGKAQRSQFQKYSQQNRSSNSQNSQQQRNDNQVYRPNKGNRTNSSFQYVPQITSNMSTQKQRLNLTQLNHHYRPSFPGQYRAYQIQNNNNKMNMGEMFMGRKTRIKAHTDNNNTLKYSSMAQIFRENTHQNRSDYYNTNQSSRREEFRPNLSYYRESPLRQSQYSNRQVMARESSKFLEEFIKNQQFNQNRKVSPRNSGMNNIMEPTYGSVQN